MLTPVDEDMSLKLKALNNKLIAKFNIDFYEYVKFCYDNDNIDCEEYFEVHHILPRSVFKQYSNYKCNLVKLSYFNHAEAHRLLASIHPIYEFITPLTLFSLKPEQIPGLRAMRSERQSMVWKSFKTMKKYQSWRINRSNSMKNKWKTEKYKESMRIMSKTLWKSDEHRKKVSDSLKAYWNNISKEEYQNICKTRKAIKSSDAARLQASINAKNMHSDEEFKKKFKETMNIVNKDEDKRNAASIALKEKWKDPEYLEKMKNRKKPDFTNYSEKMKEKWKDPEYRNKVMETRLKRYEQKRLDKLKEKENKNETE